MNVSAHFIVQLLASIVADCHFWNGSRLAFPAGFMALQRARHT
jgi:hypothetical protein